MAYLPSKDQNYWISRIIQVGEKGLWILLRIAELVESNHTSKANEARKILSSGSLRKSRSSLIALGSSRKIPLCQLD